MASMTETTESLQGSSSIEIRDLARLTVDQYDEMARLAVLDDPRIELVNGFLVRTMTKRPRHASTLDVLEQLVRNLLPPGWYARAERPIRLPPHDEPEPDLVVLRGKPGDYRLRHPGPEDVAMVVEVSDSSLRLDRGDKLLAYARAGIPHYWIVNLVDRRIEAYRDPGPDGYRSATNHDPSTDAPLAIDGVEVGRIAVKDVLPENDPAG